ncbi:MAG: M48 family metallopeptidase [Deltaproteobacteria bacterium]|nr:M48 family metallopeptidase [Deltaproteobacteria bacterium]
MRDQTFEGGVFHGSIEGGRSGARLGLRDATLTADLLDGGRLELPIVGATIEIGGASGRMVFVRTPDRSLTFFSEAPGFLDALRTLPELEGELSRVSAERDRNAKSSLKWWLGGLAAAGLLALAVPPAFDGAVRGAVGAVPFEVDEKIGAIGWASLGARTLDNDKAQAAAKAMIERLRPHASMPEAKFRISVVEDGAINAFALPGGQMALNTGLIRLAETPEEIAGVLAHEMAHVTKRHGVRSLARALGVFGGIQLLLGDVSVLVTIAAQLATLGYSREQEAEADAEGVRMLVAAGVDPEGLARFFEKMRDKQKELPEIPEWLSTHPDLTARANEVRALAETQPKPAAYKPIELDWDALKSASRLPGDATDTKAGDGSKTEEPKAEEPKAEEPKAEEPKVEEPEPTKVEGPKAG